MLTKIFRAAATALATVLTLSACGAPAERISPEPASPLSVEELAPETYAGMADFSARFAAAAASAAEAHTNTLVSPLSAYIALAMVREGAAGETLAELDAALGAPDAGEMLALLSHLSTLEETTLHLANSVWVDDALSANADFIDILAKYYLAEAYTATLADAAGQVNSWISDRTEGLIRDMVNRDSLTDTVLLLVNALYMDAEWRNKFEENRTHEREFTGSDGKVSKVDFLSNGTKNELIIAADGYTGVVLPYRDGSLQFVALLPDDADTSTAELMELVAAEGGWGAVAATAGSRNTRLYLPIFEHEYSLTLNGVLKAMGIELAFAPFDADFSGVGVHRDGENLFISKVLQKAVLRIDEEGTEAAAATVIMMDGASAVMMPEDEPLHLEFNRPFAFAVVDSGSGAVLFCGEHNVAK